MNSKIQRRNEKNWYIETMFINTSLLVCGGTIFQGFLMHYGISEANIGVYTTLTQITQAIIMFASTLFIDRIRSIKRVFTLSTLCQVVFFVTMLFFAKADSRPGTMFFPGILALAVFHNLAVGLRSIICYKIPYLIIDMNEYGRVSVTECIVLSVFSVIFSFVASKLFEFLAFLRVMQILFLFSAFMILIAAYLTTRLHLSENLPPPEKKKASIDFSLLRSRRFAAYIFPNLLRGIAGGVIGMAAVFAAKDLNADEAFLSKLVLVAQAAAFASYFIYRLMIRKVSAANMTMIGSLMFCLIPLMGLFTSPSLYLVVYFFVNVGLNFFAVGIPVIVAAHIPYETIGSYTSYRMLLTTGGTALGSLISGYAVGHISSFALYLLAAAMQLYCGIMYLRFSSIKENH